jgi:hypothetical protein
VRLLLMLRANESLKLFQDSAQYARSNAIAVAVRPRLRLSDLRNSNLRTQERIAELGSVKTARDLRRWPVLSEVASLANCKSYFLHARSPLHRGILPLQNVAVSAPPAFGKALSRHYRVERTCRSASSTPSSRRIVPSSRR